MRGLKFRSTRPSALQPIVALVALACASTAWGADDPNPYYIGISQGFTHDSNINRIPNGPSDTYSSTGLLGGFDQLIGRQHVYANANVSVNRYQDQTQLNNTSYGVNGGWDWSTIEKLSGSVYARANQSLASLDNNIIQTTTGKNLIKTEQIGTRAKWGGDSTITLQGGFGYSKVSYSAPSYQASDSNQKSADIGVFYRVGPTLNVGTSLRYTRSDADRAFLLTDGSFLANSTDGRNVDLSVDWHPTVQSGVTARASYTNQSSSASGGQGFSGLTGSLGFTYVPTGKLSFRGNISRDASTNGSFYNTFDGTTGAPTAGLSENSNAATSVNLGATYYVTAKINATAGVQYRHTTQENTQASISNGYTDNLHSGSLGLSYAFARYLSLGCNVSRVNRELTGSFGYEYGATTYGCSAQLTLR